VAAAAAFGNGNRKTKNKRDYKNQLELTLKNLLNLLPSKSNPLDASYLLECDKRLRKKAINCAVTSMAHN
jgi:hypothetical protein